MAEVIESPLEEQQENKLDSPVASPEPVKYDYTGIWDGIPLDPVDDGINLNTGVVIPETNRVVETTLSGMAGATNYKEVQTLAEFRETVMRDTLAQSAAFAKGIDNAQFTDAFSILTSKVAPRTIGESTSMLLSDKAHSKKDRAKFASNIDVHTVRKGLEENTAAILDIPDTKDVFKSKNAVATAALEELSGVPQTEESSLQEFSEWLFSDKSAATKGKELTEFINPIGMEDPEGMDIDAWQAVKDIFTGDFDSDEFDKKMTSNYGDDWGKRFGIWAFKEIGIDGGILALSFFIPPVAAALAFNKATRLARFGAAVGRAMVVGAGGTAAQYGQDKVIGRETNYATEFALRAGGYGAGEALFFGGKALYGKVFGKTMDESVAKLAAENGEKALSKADVQKALDIRSDTPSPVSSLVEHNLIADVQNYTKTMSDVADGVRAKADAQDEIMKGLANMIGRSPGEVTNLEFDTILPALVKFSDAAMDQTMKNQASVTHGVGYRLITEFDEASKAMRNITDYHFSNNKLTFRENMEGAAKQLDNWVTGAMRFARIAEPTNIAEEAATNWLRTRNFNARIANGFEKMYKETFKGVSSKEKDTLYQILAAGDKKGQIFDLNSVVPNGVNPADITPAVRKAYAKFRFMDDLAFEIHDANLTAAAKGKIKVLPDGTYVQKISTSGKKVNYRQFDRDELRVKAKGKEDKMDATKFDALDDPKSIINYRAGHLPQGYDAARYSVVVYDPKTKMATREALFQRSKEAEAYRVAREAAKEKTGSGEVILYVMNGADTGAGGMRYSAMTRNVLAGLPKDQRESVKAALKGAKLDDENIGALLDINFKPMFASTAKSRKMVPTAVTEDAKRLRLEMANYKPGSAKYKSLAGQLKAMRKDQLLPDDQQYLNYLQSIANESGEAHWRSFSGEQFLKRYSNILNPSVDPLNITKASFKGGTAIKQEAAIRHSKWLKRSVKDKTYVEEVYDNVLQGLTERMAERAQSGSRAYGLLSRALDVTPTAQNVIGGARYYLGALPKLLFFNTAQTVVQGAQAVGSIGFGAVTRNPIALMRDMSRIPEMAFMHATMRMRGSIPKAFANSETGKIYKELVQSGYAADLNQADIIFGAKSPTNPSAFRRGLNKSIQGLKTAGAAPFKLGEGINRVTAFVMVRQQFAKQIRDGAEVLGINGVRLKPTDIGGESFRAAVLEKAATLALNMGKAGQLEAMTGAGSVLLQFKQVLPKQISLFNSTALTGVEKLGTGAALIGAFGVGAVPLAYDAMRLADLFGDEDDPMGKMQATQFARDTAMHIGNMSEEVTNGLVSSKAMQRFLAYGAISAATDGEINVANRVALGAFLSDTFDVQGPEDMIVSLAVLNDYINLADKLGVNPNPFAYVSFMGDVLSGEDAKVAFGKLMGEDSVGYKVLNSSDFVFESTALQAIREVGKVYSAAGSISRALDASYLSITDPDAYLNSPYAEGFYRTSNLRPLGVMATPRSQLMQVLGITSGRVVEAYSKEDLQRRLRIGITNYGKRMVQKIRDTGMNKETMQRLTTESMLVLSEARKFAEDNGLDDVQIPKETKFMNNKMLSYMLKLAEQNVGE